MYNAGVSPKRRSPDNPERDPDHRLLMARRLRDRADLDIASARELKRPGRFHLAVMCAHQAAEKVLKAACWHVRGQQPPWGHGLSELVELLAESPRDLPPGVVAAAVLLDPLFSRTRYPSGDTEEPIPARQITEVLALRAVEAAEEI
jgi:HEPN domain-containing protein